MTERPTPERAGAGRPSTGARERILEAALEILKQDGYAGLSTAKVAAAAGQNKALIGYHFGGKQGLVRAAAEEVRNQITAEVVPLIGTSETVEELAETALGAIWGLMERDEGIQRTYFDLASQSVVDPEVREVIAEMKFEFRAILSERLGEVAGIEDPAEREAGAVLLIAGMEGLAMERLDRGETPSLAAARSLWVRSIAALLDPVSA